MPINFAGPLYVEKTQFGKTQHVNAVEGGLRGVRIHAEVASYLLKNSSTLFPGALVDTSVEYPRLYPSISRDVLNVVDSILDSCDKVKELAGSGITKIGVEARLSLDKSYGKADFYAEFDGGKALLVVDIKSGVVWSKDLRALKFYSLCLAARYENARVFCGLVHPQKTGVLHECYQLDRGVLSGSVGMVVNEGEVRAGRCAVKGSEVHTAAHDAFLKVLCAEYPEAEVVGSDIPTFRPSQEHVGKVRDLVKATKKIMRSLGMELGEKVSRILLGDRRSFNGVPVKTDVVAEYGDAAGLLVIKLYVGRSGRELGRTGRKLSQHVSSYATELGHSRAFAYILGVNLDDDPNIRVLQVSLKEDYRTDVSCPEPNVEE
jgi:hypothetical protein